MTTEGSSVGSWTRYFTVASAVSMMGLQITYLGTSSRQTIALVGLLGAVLPMVFGMGYLLLPSVVGQRCRCDGGPVSTSSWPTRGPDSSLSTASRPSM